jgi:hypothetical protein
VRHAKDLAQSRAEAKSAGKKYGVSSLAAEESKMVIQIYRRRAPCKHFHK